MEKIDPLLREANYFHHALFGIAAGEGIARHYVQAHRNLIPWPDPRQQQRVEKIMERNLDCQAVEYLFHRRKKNHLLSAKMRILVSLAEATDGYFDWFVNSRPNRVRAWKSFLFAVLRSGFRLAKGHFLVFRYALA